MEKEMDMKDLEFDEMFNGLSVLYSGNVEIAHCHETRNGYVVEWVYPGLDLEEIEGDDLATVKAEARHAVKQFLNPFMSMSKPKLAAIKAA